MKICELTIYKKNFDMVFMVIKDLGYVRTKDGNIIYSYLIADDTGSVEYSIFDHELCIGDILSINHAYSTVFKGKLKVYNSELSNVRRIGEFCLNFKTTPNMSEIADKNPV